MIWLLCKLGHGEGPCLFWVFESGHNNTFEQMRVKIVMMMEHLFDFLTLSLYYFIHMCKHLDFLAKFDVFKSKSGHPRELFWVN